MSHSGVLYIACCENLSKLQSLLIFIVYCPCASEIPKSEFEFSGAPDPPGVMPIISYLSISGALGSRIAKEFGIFTESTMLNNLQSIAPVNHYQLLHSPETDPAQCMSHHPGIERLSKRYRDDELNPKKRLTYSRLTQSIQPNISSLRIDCQAHLRPTLLSSLIVSDMTPHTYKKANFNKPPLIMNIWTRCRHASEPCIPTSHYHWIIHFAPFQPYFLPSWMLWICGCQHT